tara:strand:+ start:55 stop:300 length:246 start_codon:yes stop_codon:yes gene_type:complete
MDNIFVHLRGYNGFGDKNNTKNQFKKLDVIRYELVLKKDGNKIVVSFTSGKVFMTITKKELPEFKRVAKATLAITDPEQLV